MTSLETRPRGAAAEPAQFGFDEEEEDVLPSAPPNSVKGETYVLAPLDRSHDPVHTISPDKIYTAVMKRRKDTETVVPRTATVREFMQRAIRTSKKVTKGTRITDTALKKMSTTLGGSDDEERAVATPRRRRPPRRRAHEYEASSEAEYGLSEDDTLGGARGLDQASRDEHDVAGRLADSHDTAYLADLSISIADLPGVDRARFARDVDYVVLRRPKAHRSAAAEPDQSAYTDLDDFVQRFTAFDYLDASSRFLFHPDDTDGVQVTGKGSFQGERTWAALFQSIENGLMQFTHGVTITENIVVSLHGAPFRVRTWVSVVPSFVSKVCVRVVPGCSAILF